MFNSTKKIADLIKNLTINIAKQLAKNTDYIENVELSLLERIENIESILNIKPIKTSRYVKNGVLIIDSLMFVLPTKVVEIRTEGENKIFMETHKDRHCITLKHDEDNMIKKRNEILKEIFDYYTKEEIKNV